MTSQHAAVDKETEDEEREPSNLHGENHFSRGDVAQGLAEADVVIEPDMKSFVWDDFTRTPELVAAGEAATREVLPRIRELVGLNAPEITAS